MNSSVLAAIGGGSDQLLAGGLTPGSGPEQARLESRKLLDCTKLTFPKGLNLQENPTMDQDNPSSSGSGDPFDSLMEQFLVAEEDLPENWRHPSSAAALNVVDCPVPAQTAAAPYTGENTPMHDQEPVLEGTPTVVLDIPNNNSADIVKPVPAGINKDGVEPAIKTVKTKKRKRKGDENAKKPLKTKSRNISKKDSKKSSKKAPRKVLKGNKGSAAHAEMVQQQLTNLKLKGYECTEQELHKIKLQLAQDRHNERHTLLGRRTPTPKNNAKSK